MPTALALWIAAAVGVGIPAGTPARVEATPGILDAVLLGAVGLPGAVVLGFVTAAVLVIVSARRGRGGALLLVALAFAGASTGLAAAAAGAPNRHPVVLESAAQASRHLELDAVVTQTVVAAPRDSEAESLRNTTDPDAWRASSPGGSGSYEVRLTSVTVAGTATRLSVPARIFGDPPDGGAAIGAAVHLEGTVVSTDPADATAYLVYASGTPSITAPPSTILGWSDALRSRFRAATAPLPGDGGTLLPGLAIGDTTGLSDDLDEAMKAGSLTHLTAVSGANCAFVVGLVMLAGARLGLSRTGRVAASVLVLAAFVVLVTPEPSVLRAAVMALLVLLAISSGRPARGVPVLCLAVIGLLVVDPWLSREYGFVLSVLATAGLLLLAGPLTRVLSRWLPVPVAAAIAVPVAAQLCCQPVLILLQPTIPTYGVIANMLAGPAAPAATVIGLAACLLLVAVPPLGVALTWLAWLPAAWIAGVARFFAGLPGGAVDWVEGVPGALALAGATVAGLVVVLDTRVPRSLRRACGVGLGIGLASWAGIAAGSSIGAAASRPADWTYGMCDVGQGDASLVRSGSAVALVDAGPDAAALDSCLEKTDIGRIDLLVLTHFDLDHVGGASAVVGRVDRVLVGPTDGAEDEALLDAFESGGAEVQQVAAGATGALGRLRWEVLWPLPPPRIVVPGNDASVVMVFDDDRRCGDRCGADTPSALFLGDLGEEAQSRLVATDRVTPVDIVKVAHHGSADQSRRLYETIEAPLGLIGVGADNDYGHPAPALLELLAGTGTAVARTDREGLLLIAPGDDEKVALWRERPIDDDR